MGEGEGKEKGGGELASDHKREVGGRSAFGTDVSFGLGVSSKPLTQWEYRISRNLVIESSD